MREQVDVLHRLESRSREVTRDRRAQDPAELVLSEHVSPLVAAV